VFRKLLLLIAAVIVLVVAWEWITFPDVGELAKSPPKTTAFMDQRRAELRKNGKDDRLEYRWTSYANISPYLRRAVLVAEDNDFYEHQGVDIKGMREALERDWKRKKITHGGSTITQQLAKNLFLSGSRSYWRKGQELVITYMLEALMDKERIFEIYLNVVEFGKGIFGAEAAARHYYGIPAARLNAPQAARLAVMLPNPRYYDAHRNTNYLSRRTDIIMRRMNSADVP